MQPALGLYLTFFFRKKNVRYTSEPDSISSIERINNSMVVLQCCSLSSWQFVWHLASIKFSTSGNLTSSSHQYCLSNTEAEIIFPENLSQSEDLVAEESILQLASPYSFAT